MNNRHVIGKRIVAIRQERTTNTGHETVFNVHSIILEDGTVIVLSVSELEDDYAVEGTVYRPGGPF